MDKFGIFNLLNSFFPLNSQKNEHSSTSSGLAGNLLSSLGKNLFTPTETLSNDKQNLKKENAKHNVPLPLQQSMLSTINSHDEIVKRVNQKNKPFTT